MAIQVGGTQVISNSQGLTNIASIDSTTAASIQAAGVGGSPVATSPLDGDITSSRTIAASDLVGTGSVWVVLNGGSGSGGAAYKGTTAGSASNGGAGASYGFQLSDVDDLLGAVLTVGAGGAGVFTQFGSTGANSGAFRRNGNDGGNSTLVLSGGATITAGGGGGGGGGSGATGADGTASASGSNIPTQVTVANLNTLINTYWNDYIVTNSEGNLILGGAHPNAEVSENDFGQAGNTTAASNSTPGIAASGTADSGALLIVYEKQ